MQTIQVDDDLKLLNMMMADTDAAPDLYKPTNYWKNYEDSFLKELSKKGLKDFRRRRDSTLSAFGATDLILDIKKINFGKIKLFASIIKLGVPLIKPLITMVNLIVNFIYKKFILCTTSYRRKIKAKLRLVQEEAAKSKYARPLEDFNGSLFGNPEDVITHDNRTYTTSYLYYFLRYTYCSNYINFQDIHMVAELGCGSGKQIEILKKLHPQLTFLLFDIPPQLYVCEQYLKKVFPGEVVSYEHTRDFDSLFAYEKGKIYILSNWKFELISELPVDLFWNAASFQEMEPEIVLNYLRYVNNCAKYVYLMEYMEGREVAGQKGEFGVLDKTTVKHYTDGLGSFKMIDMSDCKLSDGYLPGYSDSFWLKK